MKIEPVRKLKKIAYPVAVASAVAVAAASMTSCNIAKNIIYNLNRNPSGSEVVIEGAVPYSQPDGGDVELMGDVPYSQPDGGDNDLRLEGETAYSEPDCDFEANGSSSDFAGVGSPAAE
ncbi:MAG: hypothetical protein IKH13_06915 [Clostridia bacterium]|nr:hypothetical protein [Clostridia bacterium]MBR6407989.1 hypothetical protein [Clostridia bacterium]